MKGPGLTLVTIWFDDDAATEDIQNWYRDVARTPSTDPDLLYSEAGPHLPRSLAPGHASWDIVTRCNMAAEHGSIRRLLSRLEGPVVAYDEIPLQVVAGRSVAFDGPRIKRTLLLSVRPDETAERVHAFERSLAAMPDHISAIRGWILGRVGPGYAGPWTHVFQQEFATLDGLHVDYLRHPYHWTGIGRWLDPEIPGAITEPDFVHIIRSASGPTLSGVGHLRQP